MSSSGSGSGRTIRLPASLVEDLVRIQAGELQRLKKQLAEAQQGNNAITPELASLVESTAKIISDLDEALTQSQEIAVGASLTPRTSRSMLSTPSIVSYMSEAFEDASAKSEAFTDAKYSSVASELQFINLSDVERNEGSESNSGNVYVRSKSNHGSETSILESIATRPLKPFSNKPSPQQHIKTLNQLGTLRQPCFYSGDELIISFTDRHQAYLITVIYTTNNAQRARKLLPSFEEFALKGWSGALMVGYEQAWYYAGTYRTTGYVKISGEEFETLAEKTKRPVYFQAAHANQVPKTGTAGTVKPKKSSSTSASSRSGSKRGSAPGSGSNAGGKKVSGNATASTSSSTVPPLKDVQAQIADGRIELAKITFSLVSWNEDVQKALIEMNL